MNQELKQLLDDVHVKPGLYIGEPSLEKLCAFIDGYLECMRKRDHVVPEYLSGFQIFVEQYYHIFGNINFHHHWSRLISFFEPTKERAFDKFYELLELYLKVESEYHDQEKLMKLTLLQVQKKLDIEDQ